MQRLVWCGCLIALLAACQARHNPTKIDVHYGLTYDPPTFDPHIATANEVGVVLRQVYDTLVYRHPETNEFVPGLATDWSISDDQLTYTFRLRDNVTFHDGTRFDAQAVATNLDRIVRLDGKALGMLGPYRGYEIVDGRTIRVRLTEPYSPLLDSLSQFYLGMASPLALSEYSTQRYQFYQSGTGPYQLVDFIPGTHIILERNTDYSWGPPFYDPANEQPIHRIKYQFFIDAATRSSVIEAGELDIVSGVLPSSARSLSVTAQVRIIPTAIPGQTSQFLMNTQNPPTDDSLVRQALLYGTNRSEIIDAVFGGFSPVARGPISRNTLYYSREMTGLYDYDIQQARDLLTSAGYEDSDDDGIVDLDGSPLEVIVLVPPGELFANVARRLESQWRIIGVKAVLKFEPTLSVLRDAVAEGEYHLVGAQASGIDPHLLTDYFASDGAMNWTGFEDETLDGVLTTGVRDNDPVVRAGAYVRAQRIIMNEALVLPIREVTNLSAVNARVQGLQFDAYGWYPLMYNARLN